MCKIRGRGLILQGSQRQSSDFNFRSEEAGIADYQILDEILNHTMLMENKTNKKQNKQKNKNCKHHTFEEVRDSSTCMILLPMYDYYTCTSNEGINLPSISTAERCLAPACNRDLVSEPGPAPTSQT